jgi:hypothetical protein
MDTLSINPLIREDLRLIIQTLQFGDIQVIGQPLVGSNATLLVSCKLDELSLHAIYKPNRGEQPLWDFPRNSLAKRETAAFIVSTLLGWNFVPPTVFRVHNPPYGTGSLQLYIPHNPRINFFNQPLKDEKTIKIIVLFDIVINNADRKAGHIIFDENGKCWLIDHGLSFHQDPKLRTVIWEYANTQIPDDLLKDLHKLLLLLRAEETRLVKKMHKLLSSAELFMLMKRIEKLLETGTFPTFKQDQRPYPWPLI